GLHGQFSEVTVAADDEKARRLRVTDQFVEALALPRKVHPLFPSMILGNDLDARREDAHLRGLAELFFEPFPLRVAEERRLGVGVGDVRSLVRHELVALLERAAEVARVEKDHLHALAYGAESCRMIDAFLGAPRGVLRDAEEVEEDLLRFLLL